MKQYASLATIIFSFLMLMSCASHYYPYLKADLTQENWVASVDTDVKQWTVGADRWFFTGEPNETEMAMRKAENPAAISTATVRVAGITRIRVNGDFQVQLFGARGENSAYVYGPSAKVRNVAIFVENGTLVVKQVNPELEMHHVIVRIGVNQLTSLMQLGSGTIEGIHLESSDLTITSFNKGNIYLSGHLNLRKVNSMRGAGSITVIGVEAPCLDIYAEGPGCVNLCGNIGIRSIIHHGTGDINIMGANSSSLSIFAEGYGKIGISGTANVRDIKALGNVAVFVTRVKSRQTTLYVGDKAYVGLAGNAANINLEAYQSANFLGRKLCTRMAYVRAKQNAHVNISACDKIFASASQYSSIYIFCKPKAVTQFVTDRAAIITLDAASRSACCP